jgi:hypothetical protein
MHCYTCDRCGYKEEAHSDQHPTKVLDTRMAILTPIPGEYPSRDSTCILKIDLCQRCREAVVAFAKQTIPTIPVPRGA